MARTRVRIQLVPNVKQVFEAQPDVRAIEEETARDALAIARDLAPVSTGHYRDSLDVDGNRLITTDPVGHLVEWGSVNNRAYAVLRNAARQVSKVVEEPK